MSLLLSEVPYADVNTLLKANKLAREMKRDAAQAIRFPAWGLSWDQLCVVTWADASQHNRPDKSSTLGYVSALAPRSILEGEETAIALVSWRSSKTPRQCLGSNGAEVQAISEAEDVTFRTRAMLMEFFGVQFDRSNIYQKVKDLTAGAVVMDSQGVFDAATRNTSALHGLRSSRAGYELTLSVNQARSINTRFRWVNGLAQLADSLTKTNSRKVMLQLMCTGQRWRLIDDPMFTAGKKLRKKELLDQIKEQEARFIAVIAEWAATQRWPWDNDPEARSVGDAFTGLFEGSC